MKLILALVLFLSSLILSAQTRKDVKIYGYVQPVSGGANPSDVLTEDGKQVQQEGKERKNYYIYMTGPAGLRIYPTEIYIEGTRYGVKAMQAVSPVELKIHNGATEPPVIELVPKHEGQLLAITPLPVQPPSSKAHPESKAQSLKNDVVISYKMGGKFYYAVLKELKELDAAAMQ